MDNDTLVTEEFFTEAFNKKNNLITAYLRKRGFKDCEDLVADAWQKAWERRYQFRGDSLNVFTSWVITIAINEGKKHLRRSREYIRHEEFGGAFGVVFQENTALLLDVHKVLDSLHPRTQRRLYEQYFMNGGKAEYGAATQALRLQQWRARKEARGCAEKLGMTSDLLTYSMKLPARPVSKAPISR